MQEAFTIRRAGLRGETVLNSEEEYSRNYIPQLTVEGNNPLKVLSSTNPSKTSTQQLLVWEAPPTAGLPIQNGNKCRSRVPTVSPSKKRRLEPAVKALAK